MLRQAGSPHRSLRLQVAILLGALTLAGCGTPTRDRPRTSAKEIDFSLVSEDTKRLREYTSALLLLNSENPNDWLRGKEQIEVLQPFHVFAEDPELIKMFRQGQPSEVDVARRELGRRGKLLANLLVFVDLEKHPYSKTGWDTAVRELVADGEDGQSLLTITLLKLIGNGRLRPLWPHARDALVQASGFSADAQKMVLETTAGLAKAKADASPPTPIWQQEDMVQIVMVLIALGPHARTSVIEISKHKNWNIRKAVALAIAESVDRVPLAEVLIGYLKDPEWQVQAAAAEAMGRMGAARETLGPILLEKMKQEKDAFVLRSVLQAIGEIHYLPAIPYLMNAIDAPRYETAEAAMFALYRLTGEKHKYNQQWKEWYRDVYPTWIKKQKP